MNFGLCCCTCCDRAAGSRSAGYVAIGSDMLVDVSAGGCSLHSKLSSGFRIIPRMSESVRSGTHPCFTPPIMGNEFDDDLLCCMEAFRLWWEQAMIVSSVSERLIRRWRVGRPVLLTKSTESVKSMQAMDREGLCSRHPSRSCLRDLDDLKPH